MRRSPDADRILALPHAQHPALAETCERCAADPSLDFEAAAYRIAVAAVEKRITGLDIEMIDCPVVPFSVTETRSRSKREEFQSGVQEHVNRLLGQRDGGAQQSAKVEGHNAHEQRISDVLADMKIKGFLEPGVRRGIKSTNQF